MTRIDFYVLESNSKIAKQNFLCRLIDKAITQGSTLLVATENEDESREIDEVLWTFKPESYIPHDIVTRPQGEKTSSPVTAGTLDHLPVRIMHGEDDLAYHDVLINLRHTAPSEFGRFERVIQIVNQTPDNLERSRKYFSFYKQRGYPIRTHKLSS